MRYHNTPIRIAKIQKTDNTKFWQDVELVKKQTGTANLENRMAVSYKHILVYDPAIVLLGIYPK